jgi:hypothetical protein
MKTTVEVSDALLREARKIATRERLTLRTLVERGLRLVVAESANKANFNLRSATFKGRGLQAEFRQAPWEKIREIAYGYRDE